MLGDEVGNVGGERGVVRGIHYSTISSYTLCYYIYIRRVLTAISKGLKSTLARRRSPSAKGDDPLRCRKSLELVELGLDLADIDLEVGGDVGKGKVNVYKLALVD